MVVLSIVYGVDIFSSNCGVLFKYKVLIYIVLSLFGLSIFSVGLHILNFMEFFMGLFCP